MEVNKQYVLRWNAEIISDIWNKNDVEKVN